MKRRVGILLALAALVSACEALTSVASIPVGTLPKFVAVNQTTNVIYVSNLNSNSVSVIDGATDTVLATIAVGTAPEILDVNTETNTIYVANLESSNVSVIDGTSNTVVATVSLGTNTSPFGLAVDSTRNLVYVTNANDPGLVYVIDGVTNTVTATIQVGNTPAGVRVNSTTNLIYVANTASGSVSVIDGSSDTVSNTFQLPQGAFPGIIAMDPVKGQLFVSDAPNKAVYVLNASTGELLQTITGAAQVSFKSPQYVALLQPGKSAMVSDSSLGAVIQFSDTNYAFTGALSATGTPIGFAVNRKTGKIYVAESSSGTVNVYTPAGAKSRKIERRAK